MKYELTDEQQEVLLSVEKNETTLVQAYAGTGKTSVSLAVVNHFKPKKGFYTAFNKSIVLEAQEKFPTNIVCQTKHAFALSYVRPTKGIESFTYLCITEKLGYRAKYSIMNVMDSFFLSSSVDMNEYVKILNDKKLEALAIKYINKMINNEIPVTFNFILKYLHLMLDQKLLEINFDLVILDEAQDTTEVFYEIFKLIKCKNKLIVGDSFQNIYGYMNTVNVFKLIKDIKPLKLTKTFRCSEAIAKRVETFGKKYLSKDFEYEGTDSKDRNGTIAYIGRTNGSILMRLQEILESGKGFSLTRPVKEIFALPMALANVSAGRTVYHKQYKYLEGEYKRYTVSGMKGFYSYLLKYVDDDELHSCINFMSIIRDKNINIFQLKKDAENIVSDSKTWIVTAHSFKGREVDTVVIEDSLNKSVMKIIAKGGPKDSSEQEELHLGYVGATRSKYELLNCKFL